ncbi:Clp protease ClpP [Staphylococcus chromogenes]|nr:Clp protease ClpP [Staphylococcus chromogenes]
MANKIPNVVPQFKNEIKNNTHILTLNGVVASDEFDNTISFKRIENALKNTDKNVVIKLASGGGDAFEGINIYNYLRNLTNHVTVEITSLAASAASIIAMGADEIIMHTGANMMIHEAALMAFGNKSQLQKALNAVESADKSIVEIYHERTGLDKQKIISMMAEETWMTADEAIEHKFADKKMQSKEVIDMDKGQLVASLKEQQKMLAQMIVNVSGEEEPNSNETLEQRLANVENEVKNLKSRVEVLEDGDSGDDSEETSNGSVQNKFNRFAF